MIKCVFAHIVPEKGVDFQNCAVELSEERCAVVEAQTGNLEDRQ